MQVISDFCKGRQFSFNSYYFLATTTAAKPHSSKFPRFRSIRCVFLGCTKQRKFAEIKATFKDVFSQTIIRSTFYGMCDIFTI